ncbi:unnamed protein product [Mytilus coruscus]|uniref:Uncharacterized protein n=1 Tax=Mytilus coruscus TaxID=42192 RepID=A0A6J8ETU5_MYTCO|nr:unnamed protein product [Mytilus coruscus]
MDTGSFIFHRKGFSPPSVNVSGFGDIPQPKISTAAEKSSDLVDTVELFKTILDNKLGELKSEFIQEQDSLKRKIKENVSLKFKGEAETRANRKTKEKSKSRQQPYPKNPPRQQPAESYSNPAYAQHYTNVLSSRLFVGDSQGVSLAYSTCVTTASRKAIGERTVHFSPVSGHPTAAPQLTRSRKEEPALHSSAVVNDKYLDNDQFSVCFHDKDHIKSFLKQVQFFENCQSYDNFKGVKDDGFGMSPDENTCYEQSSFVKRSLIDAGFFINEEKSVFKPVTELEWLGIVWNSKEYYLSIAQRRVDDLISSLNVILANFPYITARSLAQLFTDSVVNNISETHVNRSFDLNEEHNTEHVYANVQILNPTTSSTCSNEFQSDSTDNIIYTAIALPNENETIVSRNAEDFDTIEQIDEVSSHQGEGNVNNTTGKQNVEKTEEQNEDTIEEQNVQTSCDTNANDETMRSRKRKKQSELWKQNLRKRRHISGRRIQWFFDKKSPQFEDKRGRHVKRKISDESKDRIRNHINSFPRIDSHYCRSSVKRQYLDPCLSIAKMYELYVLTCNATGVIPEKYHTYKNIFNLEFNLGFHTPKKDRCDHCEEYKSNKLINQVSEDLNMKYELHIVGKSNSKVERDNDRIWSEHIAGRGANEISSALLKILEKVLEDFPTLETITLWSDSCIPQNRNSIVVSALQHFMRSDKSYSLKSVEHKFSEPGHSSIQEVDCVHSHIEKALNLSEIFSPVSFLRMLTRVRKRSMKVIQLQPEHFFNFQAASRTFKYNSVPFTKIKYIKLEVEKPLQVLYKVSFSDESFKEVSIVAQNTRKKQKTVVMPKINMLIKSTYCQRKKSKI